LFLVEYYIPKVNKLYMNLVKKTKIYEKYGDKLVIKLLQLIIW
jgi:hypothetical protein